MYYYCVYVNYTRERYIYYNRERYIYCTYIECILYSKCILIIEMYIFQSSV